MFSVFEAAAQIQIVINTPQVYLGGAVTGIVVLKVIKESIDGNSVVLTFNCREDTRADYTSTSEDSEGRSSTTHHSTYQSAVILEAPLVLGSSSNGSFTQGQYEFPFTINVQPDLPPTMSATMDGSEGGACSINYSLHAKLERSTGLFKYKIEDTKPFIVLPVMTPTNTPRSPVVIGVSSIRASFCCCLSRGKFDLGLVSPSNWYMPNEKFQVNYVVQNDSHAKVQKFTIGYQEKITWIANRRTRFQYRKMDDPVIGHNIFDLAPLRKQSEKQALSMEQLNQALMNGTYKCSINIPSTASASYKGQIITITHCIVLSIVTPWGTSNPSIECPITVAWKIYSGPGSNTGTSLLTQGVNNNNSVSLYNSNAVVPFAEAVVVSGEGIQMSSGYQQVPMADSVSDSKLTPSAPPSYQDWLTNFKLSLNQVLDIHNCPQAIIQSLNAFQFSEIFSSVRSSLDSVAIAEIITERRSAITCELILAAVSVSSSLVKGEILRKFAVKCIDKENKSILRQGLSEMEFIECCELLR